MAVHFIPDEIVPIIHADLLKRYGGTLGIRDRGLLASALAQPKMTAGKKFLHRTIFKPLYSDLVSLTRTIQMIYARVLARMDV